MRNSGLRSKDGGNTHNQARVSLIFNLNLFGPGALDLVAWFCFHWLLLVCSVAIGCSNDCFSCVLDLGQLLCIVFKTVVA